MKFGKSRISYCRPKADVSINFSSDIYVYRVRSNYFTGTDRTSGVPMAQLEFKSWECYKI